MRKTLCTLVALASLSLAGCDDVRNNPEYEFNGKIDGAEVRFYETFYGASNYLEVKDHTGITTLYADYNDDFELDYIQIKIGNSVTQYSKRSTLKKTKDRVKRAQTVFDAYLKRILEAKKR